MSTLSFVSWDLLVSKREYGLVTTPNPFRKRIGGLSQTFITFFRSSDLFIISIREIFSHQSSSRLFTIIKYFELSSNRKNIEIMKYCQLGSHRIYKSVQIWWKIQLFFRMLPVQISSQTQRNINLIENRLHLRKYLYKYETKLSLIILKLF